MLLSSAFNTLMAIYLGAALLPAIFLLIYIYKQDKADKESLGLLGKCLLGGIWAALLAIILETVGNQVLDNSLNMSEINLSTEMYTMIFAFVIVACAEEFAKFFFLKRYTWKNPEFNYHFDAIVYAVFVSLGFAMFENLKYVGSYGLGVALPRAFLAIPGHMSFAVLMGCFYGRAKYLENHGKRGKGFMLFLAWFVPMLLHGAYDSCAMIGTTYSSYGFIAIVLIIYIIVFFLVRKESREDYKVVD